MIRPFPKPHKIIPWPKPLRLPKRKRVTLIAGFCCQDGIVLCADAQETVDDIRVATQKIEPKLLGNYDFAIGGSGDGDLIDAAVNSIEEIVEVSAATSTVELREDIQNE